MANVGTPTASWQVHIIEHESLRRNIPVYYSREDDQFWAKIGDDVFRHETHKRVIKDLLAKVEAAKQVSEAEQVWTRLILLTPSRSYDHGRGMFSTQSRGGGYGRLVEGSAHFDFDVARVEVCQVMRYPYRYNRYSGPTNDKGDPVESWITRPWTKSVADGPLPPADPTTLASAKKWVGAQSAGVTVDYGRITGVALPWSPATWAGIENLFQGAMLFKEFVCGLAGIAREGEQGLVAPDFDLDAVVAKLQSFEEPHDVINALLEV